MHAPPTSAGLLAQADHDSATEHFLVYGYKVVPCSKRYRHDWSVCPFAHTGEMAARRDPSRYLPIFCFHSKQRLPCPRGEECPYSHNLFEYWLHPQRYRTEMCQFGAACTRPVCFFAHGEHQLRHTSMPGGPQPVVAPPEPIPGLGGGFGGRELPGAAVDPAVKQQQQLIALQAAASNFNQHQVPATQHQQHAVAAAQQQQQHQQHAAAVAAAASSTVLPSVDGLGGGADGLGGHAGNFSSLMHGDASNAPLDAMSHFSHHHLPASSPLSAPLPQLTPDMLAALQGMPMGPSGALSPAGMTGPLMHQHSGMPAPAQRFDGAAGGNNSGRLQRSLTAHPAMNAAAAAAANSNANLEELSQQLAVIQLMSGPLPDLGSQQMEHLLGMAQLQQQHDHHAAAAAAAVSAGLDLSQLLPGGFGGHDASLSCPLPPVFAGQHGGRPGSALQQLNTHVSCGLPRVPTAGGVSSCGAPGSPSASERSRDAPSPVGAYGRDTQVPAPSKKGQPWSAPVSPCNSTGKEGNDLLPPCGDDTLLPAQRSNSNVSSSTSSSVPASDPARLPGAVSLVGELPSFSAGMGGSAAPSLLSAEGQQHLVTASSGVSSSGDTAPLLLVGDSPLEASQVHAALAGGGDACRVSAIGHDKATALLAGMDEAAVAKLLALVQQQQL